MKEGKFEKINASLELEEEKLVVDIEVDEKTEKEVFEKYEDLDFLIESIGTEYDELTDEEIEEGLEQAPEDAGYLLEPENLGLDIEDPEERERVHKVILKNAFEQIGFNPKAPKLIKEEEEEIEGRKIHVKYFELENPNLVLSFDGTDWCVQSRKGAGI